MDPETGTIGQSYSGSGELYSPDKFNVRESGDNVQVLLPQPLDRDYPRGHANWQINLRAQDSGGKYGYSVMNLRLVDINDNAPKFDPCCLVGHVPEDSTGLCSLHLTKPNF